MKNPPTVLFTNGKGGTGKTTSSLGVACAFAAAGYQVGLLDTDTQKSTSAVLQLPAFKEIQNLRIAGKGERDFDIIIADSPGRANEWSMKEAFASAALVCLVTTPTYLDLSVTKTTFEAFKKEAPDKRYCFLFNCYNPNRRMAKQALDNLEVLGLANVPVLNTKIPRLVEYEEFTFKGWPSLSPDGRGTFALISSEIYKLAAT